MLGGQPVQVGDHLGGAAQPQRRPGQLLGGQQAQFVQPGRFQVCPGQAAELLERRAAPGRQRGGEPGVHGRRVVQPCRLLHLFLEPPGIDLGRGELYRIARCRGDQDTRGCPCRSARLQRAPQMRDIRLQRRERPGRCLIGVQILDEAVGGDHPAACCDQPGQHAPLPRPADIGPGAVDGDVKRAEHPDTDHEHLADKTGQYHPDAPPTGPQVGGKCAPSQPPAARLRLGTWLPRRGCVPPRPPRVRRQPGAPMTPVIPETPGPRALAPQPRCAPNSR